MNECCGECNCVPVDVVVNTVSGGSYSLLRLPPFTENLENVASLSLSFTI